MSISFPIKVAEVDGVWTAATESGSVLATGNSSDEAIQGLAAIVIGKLKAALAG